MRQARSCAHSPPPAATVAPVCTASGALRQAGCDAPLKHLPACFARGSPQPTKRHWCKRSKAHAHSALCNAGVCLTCVCRYKDFLDSVTPSEWFIAQAEKQEAS